MEENSKTYRVHTKIGSDSPNVINVPLMQTYNPLEILTVKITQEDSYKLYESSYGIIVGRVLANDAFGIPNAKISVFISVEEGETIANKILYPYRNVRGTNDDGVRYNLLPDEQVSECHQNVGTFPNKRIMLDNNDIIDIFDKYWKYTTVTNEYGDYMLFGVPTGDQEIHVDIDMSDIGVLSQRPRDMVYKGYNIDLFESPNKFKQSNNLDSLAQIYSQNKGVYVYPYWGDSTETNDTIAITRCDIQIEYKFEPTCVFMGCIITDQGENAIGKNCTPYKANGRMDTLTSGEGTIEMIRKTIDNKVEEYQIKGNRLIDSDGVWCYQIPMNLDYVRMDEYGNIVPTDNPEKGIPTRTRVRFRISLDETPNDAEARKRCKYLVPNNPNTNESEYPIFNKTKEFDYEFGTATRDEDYRDLFWNKVYTVKNYIPRLQKGSKENNKHHTGIKAINFYGNNNPFPYNSVLIKLSFTYKIICVLVKFILYLVMIVNFIFSTITSLIEPIYKIVNALDKTIILRPVTRPLKAILNIFRLECIGFGSEFCDDGINKVTYYMGCIKPGRGPTIEAHNKKNEKLPVSDREDYAFTGILNADETTLFTCIEQQLAEDNDCINFNFHNDWINGALYAPLWYRKITPKKTFFFGIFKRKAKDQWCSSSRSSNGSVLFQPCAVNRQISKENNNSSSEFINNNGEKKTIICDIGGEQCKNEECYSHNTSINLINGLIRTKDTIDNKTVYYYEAGEYQQNLNDGKGEILTLFATDIVLLGSLNDCDSDGIPQFFKSLTSTTYNMPNNILVVDGEVEYDIDDDGNLYQKESKSFTEATGADWGNINKSDEYQEDYDSGLFYGVGCLKIEGRSKSCINLSRICEFGVTLDETKYIENIESENANDDSNYRKNLLIPDGYISYDEIMNIDERSMFATMNGNHLKTKLNSHGIYEYDIRYYYVDNFDGSMRQIMEDYIYGAPDTITYKNNYIMERLSKDYYHFRMGDYPFYYDKNNSVPRYDNSFYFYFGIHPGSTAIEKFNSQFYASCENASDASNSVQVEYESNSWCDNDGAYIKLNLTGISTPYKITLSNNETNQISYTIENENSELIYFSKNENTASDFDGYKFIPVLDLPNSVYTIKIEDNDDNVSEFTVELTNKYINFSTYVYDMKIANNILLEKYGSYCEIAKESINDNVSFIENETNESPSLEVSNQNNGGLIGIYNIYCNNESVGDNVVITVESNLKISENSSDVWKLTAIIHDGKLYDSEYACKDFPLPLKILNYEYNDKNGSINMPYYVIAVPKGNIDYTVTVKQLCYTINEETGEKEEYYEVENSYSTTVTVAEPKPYKLYINDVDYDLIRDFESGYSINGIRPSENGKVPSQWLNVSNKDNYNWDANEYYTEDYYKSIGSTDKEAKEKVKIKKDELIDAMKTGFMIRCSGSPFSITFRVETDNVPYTLLVGYKEEEYNDDGYNIISSCENIVEETSVINDIAIPTITSIHNERYGNKEHLIPGSSEICYAYDPASGCMKTPYYVAVVNSTQNTIPNGITLSNGELNESNLVGFFPFHIIDKSMDSKYTAWSYFNGIPYYKPDDSTLNGKTFTRKGILAGYIYNGISSSTSVEAKFNEQLLEDEQIIIRTTSLIDGSPDGSTDVRPNEDAIPTKRVIYGAHENGEDKMYNNYIIDSSVADETYASVDYSSLELKISDDYCSIEETIHGKMYIQLDTDNLSINSRNKNALSFKVTARNKGSYANYYIIPYKNTQGDFIINQIGANSIDSYDDYYYMKYDYSEDTIKNISELLGRNFKSEYTDLSTNEMSEKNGWGSTGLFTLSENISSDIEPFFIIAISDNTRCLSPVYEFYFYDAEIRVIKYSQEGYRFMLKLSNTEKSYYLSNFDFTVNINMNVSFGDKSFSINSELKNKTSINDDDIENINVEDLYSILNSIQLIEGGLARVEDSTEIYVKDYLNIVHISSVSIIIENKTIIS